MPQLVEFDGVGGSKPLALRSPLTLMGRDGRNDIVVSNQRASRVHAAVVCDGVTATIQDMGSRNGVYVNGVKVTCHCLANGDTIALGAAIFRFVSPFLSVEQVDETHAMSLFLTA